MGSSPAAIAAKNQAAKNSAAAGKVCRFLFSAVVLCYTLSRLGLFFAVTFFLAECQWVEASQRIPGQVRQLRDLEL
jgi:hypothetical protein